MARMPEDFQDEKSMERLKGKIAALEQEITQREFEKGNQQAQGIANYSGLLKQLEDAEARYYGLFEGVPDAILITDAQSNYTDANAAATALLGYSHAQFLKMKVADIMSIEPAQTEAMFSEFTQKGYWRGEVELRHCNGKLIAAESNATVIKLLSGTIYVAIIRDISERKELEKQKDEFIMVASHDLRSPLTSIMGHAQMLERDLKHQLIGKEPDRNLASQTKYLESLLLSTEIIVHESQRMRELINRLFEFNLIQSGRLELYYSTPANLVALLKQALAQHRVASETHTLQLEAAEEEIWVTCDEARIEEVLDNLISNAIKYSPPGSTIKAGITLKSEENQVVIWVQDQGYGIAEAAQQRLFERFYRVRSEQTKDVTGLGLGLYISSKIVKEHGGQMWIKSRPGEGSTFYFSLPLNVLV